MTRKFNFLILLGLLYLMFSCKKEKHVMWISIKNETKYTIDCELYPTKTANGYTRSAHIDTIMKMDDIYASENLNQLPEDLLLSAYDSIIVRINDLNKTLVFKKDFLQSYKLNPYNDKQAWTFENFTEDFNTSFRRNTTEIDNYYFSISMENMADK
jgi:hypothetical protein